MVPCRYQLCRFRLCWFRLRRLRLWRGILAAGSVLALHRSNKVSQRAASRQVSTVG